MRILLDENVRASFADHLVGHEAFHVDALGLKSLTNGALLEYARSAFDAFLTLDRGILHQQRHEGALRILVIRVPDSTIESLIARLPDVLGWLGTSAAGDRSEI
ncbi:MAG: DUF5615 family PIN-like protein [Fimbriimonadales bacterium]